MAGLDKAELKKFLKMSRKRGPMNMAFAIGGDGKAIIQIEKIKPPRTIERTLKSDAPDSKNHRFGTVYVDPEEPKLAQFVVNKAGGGLARRLIVQLKGTGFTKVKLLTEDGAVCEEDEGEDEEVVDQDDDDHEDELGAADGQDSMPVKPTLEMPQDAIAPEETHATGLDIPPDGQDGAAPPDAQTLTKDLTGLVKQMLTVIAADPSQKAALTELATDAQANLKGGDLRQAAASIDILRRAIELSGGTASSASAAPAASPPANGEEGASSAKQPAQNGSSPAFVKARAAWLATRQRVEGEVDKLYGAMSSVYKDHGVSGDLEKFFRKKVEPMLQTLDESLSDKLDEVTKNADPEQHEKLVQEAKRIMQSYQDYLAREPLIAMLDNNPFVSLSIEKTLTTTLSALSRAVA